MYKLLELITKSSAWKISIKVSTPVEILKYREIVYILWRFAFMHAWAVNIEIYLVI